MKKIDEVEILLKENEAKVFFTPKELKKMAKEINPLQDHICAIVLALIIKKKSFFPRTNPEQVVWFANYGVKLPTFTSQLVLTTDELLVVSKDAAMFKYLMDYENAVKLYLKALTAYRKNLLKGKTAADIGAPPVCPVSVIPTSVLSALLFRTFEFIKNIKSRAGMTDSIQTTLKIVGDDIAPFDPELYIANGSAKTSVEAILIDFKKGEFIDGMVVYQQRGTNPDFIEVGRPLKKGFEINSPNTKPGPETRNYKTRGFIGNTIIGEFSPIFTITWTSPTPPPPPPEAPETPTA